MTKQFTDEQIALLSAEIGQVVHRAATQLNGIISDFNLHNARSIKASEDMTTRMVRAATAQLWSELILCCEGPYIVRRLDRGQECAMSALVSCSEEIRSAICEHIPGLHDTTHRMMSVHLETFTEQIVERKVNSDHQGRLVRQMLEEITRKGKS